MKIIYSGIIATIFSSIAVNACPGSPASLHAKCEMSIYFPDSTCEEVQEEILYRGKHFDGWMDPHHNGSYQISSSTSDKVTGSRLTGDKLYTDLFDFEFTTSEEKSGCRVVACSESQVNSVLDFSTNYCNLRMLYCNSNDGCQTVKHDMAYEENYGWGKCSQRTVSKCIIKTSNEF